ncbi:MAG: hypothetical protein WBB41_01360, partial [Candidatus Nanopelagicales bacterium]
VTLASVFAATPPAAATTVPVRPTYQIAATLLSEISDAAPVFGVADSHLYDLAPDELTARLTELRELGVLFHDIGYTVTQGCHLWTSVRTAAVVPQR